MEKNKERILTVDDRPNERFLRKCTDTFTLLEKDAFRCGGKIFTRKDITALLTLMRRTMKAANGIGLSANQIGLPYRLFIAQVPDTQGNQKLYAIFNPKLERASKEMVVLEEGCLSIPDVYGNVARSRSVMLHGIDRSGKSIRIKAWGLLAHVFQHEIDHLDGKLFTDRTKDVHAVPAAKNPESPAS